MEGLGIALTPEMLIINLFITIFAIIMGSLPGIGSGLAMTLLMPFTFFMSPPSALLVLGAVYNAAIYGGGISSILINTPGTGGNAATCIDGYALSQKGRAGEALGASLVASVMAGLLSVIALKIFGPPIASFSLLFGPAEYFWLGLLGLSIIASVASKDFVKALVATSVGLMLSFVGYDAISGTERYTFGIMEMFDGISLLALVIGVFAVAEVLKLSTQSTTIAEAAEVKGGFWKGAVMPFKHMVLWFKSSVLGVIMGAVPGVGMVAANFMAYAEAQRSSKHPEEFGNGSVEGVIAPEAANNATTGGSMIPALTLGIPGSETTAIFLGAVFMHGMRPGVDLFTRHAEAFGALTWGMIIGLVFIFFWGALLMKYWARITQVPLNILMPTLIMVMAMGAYAAHNSNFDITVAFAMGLAGYIMRKYKYSTICLLLSFILAPIIEENYVRAMVMGDGNFVSSLLISPLSIGLFVLVVLSLVFAVYRDYLKPHFKKNDMENNV